MKTSSSRRMTVAFALLGASALFSSPAADGQQADKLALQPKAEFVATDGDIKKLLITPDGRTLIGIGPYVVHIWRINTGTLVSKRSVAYPENIIQDIEVDASGRTLAYLVSGMQSEVVFISLETGQRVDVRSGKPVVAGGAAPKPGEGSWRLPSLPVKTTVPRSIAMQGRQNSEVTEVAVAYSSGTIQVLNLATTMVAEVQTKSLGLRSVEFDADGRLVWVGPQGYGTRWAKEAATNAAFPNTDSYFLHDRLWMISDADDQPVVRTYDTKLQKFTDVRWQATKDPVTDVKPLANDGFLAMYDNGDFGVHDVGGQFVGRSLSLNPAAAGASSLRTTDFAISPTGLLVATARGPVVSVYELPSVRR